MSEKFHPPSPEQIAPMDRIVGISESDQEKIAAVYGELGIEYRKGTEEVEGEVEKTERQKEIITLVKSALHEFLGRYGRPQYPDVPIDRIHVVPNIKKFGSDPYGTFTYNKQSVVIKIGTEAQFAMRLFHELLHSASYIALQQVMDKKDGSIEAHIVDGYHLGLMIVDREATNVYFEQLNEAVVQTATSLFFDEKVMGNSDFQSEDGGVYAIWETPELYVYDREREAFRILVNDLFKKNREHFTEKNETVESVRDIFIQASLSGNMLPLARLIEGTYGKGSFRELGESLTIFISRHIDTMSDMYKGK